MGRGYWGTSPDAATRTSIRCAPRWPAAEHDRRADGPLIDGLEATLRGVRERGAKSFVPYVTGGYPGVDMGLLRKLAAAGADAIEVGIPHSDPIKDGDVIQEASRVALERGTRLDDVLAAIAAAAVDVPVAVMTYANIVHHRGYEAFCDDLAASGV